MTILFKDNSFDSLMKEICNNASKIFQKNEKRPSKFYKEIEREFERISKIVISQRCNLELLKPKYSKTIYLKSVIDILDNNIDLMKDLKLVNVDFYKELKLIM